MDTSADIATRDGRTLLAEYLAGKTQAEFASRVQCSESHLSLILKGERGMSLALAKRISAASGIAIEDLPHEPTRTVEETPSLSPDSPAPSPVRAAS